MLTGTDMFATSRKVLQKFGGGDNSDAGYYLQLSLPRGESDYPFQRQGDESPQLILAVKLWKKGAMS